MDKLKEYKYIVLGVVILGAAFYWFQLRPAQIRKECYAKTLATMSNFSAFGSEVVIKETKQKEVEYENCLKSRGL